MKEKRRKKQAGDRFERRSQGYSSNNISTDIFLIKINSTYINQETMQSGTSFIKHLQIRLFAFVMHSWWDRFNYGTDDVMPTVKPDLSRMHNKNEVGNSLSTTTAIWDKKNNDSVRTTNNNRQSHRIRILFADRKRKHWTAMDGNRETNERMYRATTRMLRERPVSFEH